jgi:hypothetical protein
MVRLRVKFRVMVRFRVRVKVRIKVKGKDSNLVFSRFISCGEVLCYNRAKINSFILKCLENS